MTPTTRTVGENERAETARGVHKVAALVVTYFPDAGCPRRLDKLLSQVDRLVIVDNGTDAAGISWIDAYSERPRVTTIRNDDNLGIAAALNQGMNVLADGAYDWVFTSDQDSTVTDGCVAALLAAVSGDPHPDNIALVGSNRQDTGANISAHRWLRPSRRYPFFERVTCDQIERDGVTLVITSGTLTSMTAYRQLGSFREDFFIDLVDTEYCLRARKAGYRILVSCDAMIFHRIGSKRQRRLLGLTISPMHHGPLRKYYIFRNAVDVIRRYGRAFPHWLIYQVLGLAEVAAGILIFENQKSAKLRACMIGAWDGLLGRRGPARREF